MKLTPRRLLIHLMLATLVALGASCRSVVDRVAAIPTLDYVHGYVPRFGLFSYEFAELPNLVLTPAEIDQCLADWHGKRPEIAIKLLSVRMHPSQRFFLAVFSAMDPKISDLRLIYIYDRKKNRFVGMTGRSLA